GGKRSRWGGLDTTPCQEGVCQHQERNVTITPAPTPELVVVQAHIRRVCKIFLDVPPRPEGLHHLMQRGGRWPEDEVVREVLRIAQTPTQQEPVPSILLPLMQDRHARPVKQPGTFGPFAHREALPLVLLEQERWHVTDVHLSASSGRLHDPDRFVAGDS